MVFRGLDVAGAVDGADVDDALGGKEQAAVDHTALAGGVQAVLDAVDAGAVPAGAGDDRHLGHPLPRPGRSRPGRARGSAGRGVGAAAPVTGGSRGITRSVVPSASSSTSASSRSSAAVWEKRSETRAPAGSSTGRVAADAQG